MALTIVLGFAYAWVESVSGALFIAQLGSGALPYAYLATAVVIAGGAAAYNTISRRVQAETLLIQLGLVLFLGTAACWGWHWLTKSPAATFTLFAWAAAVRSTTLAIFWMLGRRLSGLHQRKHLESTVPVYGLGAQAVGFMLAAVSTRYWLAADLLFVSAVAYGIALLFLFALVQTHSPSSSLQPPRIALRFVVKDPESDQMLLSLPLSMFLALAAHYIVTYLFFARAEQMFQTAEDLMVLLGAVLGAATLATIVVKRWIAPAMLQRWGVPVLLVGLPMVFLALMFAGVAITVVNPAFVLSASAIPLVLYWLDSAVRYTIFGSNDMALGHLLLPKSADEKAITGCTVASVALGAVGLILAVIQLGDGTLLTSVGLFFFVVVSFWFVVNIWLARSYPQLLSASLRQKETLEVSSMRNGIFDLPDRSALNALERALDDSSETVRLYAVDRLASAAPARLYPHLSDLLNSSQERIQILTLQKCRTLRLSKFAPTIADLLRGELPPAVRSEAIRTLAATDPKLALEAIRAYIFDDTPVLHSIDEDELDVLSVAVVVALHYGDPAMRTRAELLIRTLVDDPRPSVRRIAGRILADGGNDVDTALIRRLLGDSDVTVRAAALDAADTARDPSLFPAILATMEDASLRAKAQSLLFQAGSDAIPLLEDALLEPSLSRPVRVALIEVCGALDDSRTTALLLAQINDPHDEVRATALTALQRLNYRAGRYMRKRLVDETTYELHEASQLITIAGQVSEHPDIDPDAAALFLRAMEQAWLCRRDNALHRMSFLSVSRPLGETIASLHSMDPGRRRLAADILMASLNDEQRQMIRPFLSELPVSERAGAVQILFPQPERSLQGALLYVKEIGQRSSNDWLRSCAAYALATIRDTAAAFPPAVTLQVEEHDNLFKPVPEPLYDIQSTMDEFSAGEQIMITTIQRVLFLRSVELFRSVPDDVLAWVAEAAVEVFIPQGQRFIAQGEQGDALFIVISGYTDIVINGKGTVARRGPKSVFGEMGVLTSLPRTANCVAATEISALKLGRRDFLELMARAPQLALGIIDVLVQRLDDVTRRVDVTDDRRAPLEAEV